MTPVSSTPAPGNRVIIIGAGIAGLAAAARLAHAGRPVLVLERHATPGGKMRTLPSAAGPVDTGPTVLTLKPVFDALFHDIGERLEDHVTLIRQHLLARHFWPDGSRLDLFDDHQQNLAAVKAFAGPAAADQFDRFSSRAKDLFEGFDAPVMQAPKPSLPALTAAMLRNPSLITKMAPLSTLSGLLNKCFDDPRLAQLFGRFATYVGGSPYHAPALLSLIWQAESAGVWVVRGGMHQLAKAIERVAAARGAIFQYGADVASIDVTAGRTTGVTLTDGTYISAGTVLFNGDPRALAIGALGAAVQPAASQTAKIPRSLSAQVWAFAAKPQGVELAHHNVFFRNDPKPEFEALETGHLVDDPTLYVCAMDRGLPDAPQPLERYEIIANAPPLTLRNHTDTPQETAQCHTRTFQTLARFGLTFAPEPGPDSLTTPQGFGALFPASAGSLYGQSPHGTMAAFRRPTARTPIRGLYLAGGGTHPGAGVPMATLSAAHAAAAILTDQTSTSTSRRTAMPGGMSTASPTQVAARSASSGS